MVSQQKSFDVIVVGAGPIGANTAALIAKRGYNVALVERHPRDSKFSRCGCLVTPRVLDIVDGTSAVLNKVRGAIIYSPLGRKIVIDGQQTKAIVLDRAEFDDQLVSKADKNGVECMFSTIARTASYKNGGLEVTLTDNEIVRKTKCKILIGADGAQSNVARWFSLTKPRKILQGCEQIMSNVAGDERFVKIFTGKDFAPSFFGWIIPCGDIARVGLCVDTGNVRRGLERMLAKPAVKEYLDKAKAERYYTGQIPIGYPKKTYTANVMIVGDAACQVKATSGGGLYMGLLCSTFCAENAIKALEDNDFSSKKMSHYHRAYIKIIGKELRRDLAIHESFARLNDNQLDEISRLLDKPSILDIITKYGDIDFQSNVGWALVRKEPRLIKYAGKALRAILPKFS